MHHDMLYSRKLRAQNFPEIAMILCNGTPIHRNHSEDISVSDRALRLSDQIPCALPCYLQSVCSKDI